MRHHSQRVKRCAYDMKKYSAKRMSATAAMAFFSLILTDSQLNAQPSAQPPSPGYVELADLGSAAPLVVHVVVDESIVVPAERARGVAPGYARIYVEADVQSLIRGRAGISESIRYLVDMPLDSRGKAPKLKKQAFILFANPVAGRPGEVQLISENAQLAWTPETDRRVRSVLQEIVSSNAPPDFTGIREALHVAGNLQGEGETQIFLETADGSPASITVLRRPGLRPQWAISLSEIVDEAATAPRPNTLLWYKMACFLPDALPQESLLSSNDRANEVARADYQYVRQQLGQCVR